MKINKLILQEYRKYLKSVQEKTYKFHLKEGIKYEIPLCCIKQFCEENKMSISSGAYRSMTFKFPLILINDYVPCNKCMEKIIKAMETT